MDSATGWSDFESDYADLVRDVLRAGYETYELKLRDFIDFLDQQPLSIQRVQTLEDVDFAEWYARCQETVGSFVGSGELAWARDKTKRLGQQLALFRHFATTPDAYIGFASEFLYGGSKFNEMIGAINRQLFEPFARDLLKDLRRTPEHTSRDVSSSAAPASDRIVRLDHNAVSYKQLLADLELVELAAQSSNSLTATAPDEQDRAVAEVKAGRTLLEGMSVRVNVLWGLLSVALGWFLVQFAEHAIGPVIERALGALQTLLRVSP